MRVGEQEFKTELPLRLMVKKTSETKQRNTLSYWSADSLCVIGHVGTWKRTRESRPSMTGINRNYKVVAEAYTTKQ
jgi:hypothetical protein